MVNTNKRRGLGATLATPSALEAQEAKRRRDIRNTRTPKDALPAQINALHQYCLRQLQQSFDDNKVKMQAWVELPDCYPLDVINGVKKIFEKPGNDWTVVYEFSDMIPFSDHLGFTPPKDWIERLLKA